MAEQIPSKKQRLVFIDVMRGIAVLLMIETHVVDVVLQNSLKTGFFYTYINLLNGFIAVSFLFCAGAGFWIAATRKAEDYKMFKAPLWVYLRRLGLVLAIAYWLHFPALSLNKFFYLRPQDWITFFECDVLQTIVYSSLIALFLLLVTPGLKILPYIFSILALVVFLAAPYVWNVDPMASMPPFFGALFAKYPISKFPLLPWSGYFFSGVAITAFFLNTENKKKLSWILMIGSAILLVLLFNTRFLTDFYPGFRDWWRCSPFHSLFRVCGSIFAFSMLYLLEKYYKETRPGKMLLVSGQESLFIYTSHLLVIYGSIANYGLKYFVGNRMEWFGTMMVIISLCTACYALAVAWHLTKANNQNKSRFVMAAVSALFLLIFIFNPA